MANSKPAVIVISSHVARGTVGNRAAAFALEIMGYPVWIVPTVILPWHPGHGPAQRIVPSQDDFDALIDNLINAPWLDEVGAVLSGYLGNAEQAATVARLVAAVKERNPQATYALDPVMGDQDTSGNGRLYVSEEQAAAMRDLLVPLADLITPNPFELAWLTGAEQLASQEALHQAATRLGSSLVLATSAPALMDGHIGNLLVINRDGRSTAHVAEHRLVDGPTNGTGDLAASLMLGNYLATRDPVDSLQKTSASLSEVMQRAAKANSDELPLEASLASIIRPSQQIVARSLLLRRPKT